MAPAGRLSVPALAAVVVVVLAARPTPASAQDDDCDFSQYAQPGQTYYVYSPGYPNNYRPGVTCRWIATAPANYNIQLDCSEIRLPPGCVLDRLLVSRSGDSALAGADVYCGNGTLRLTSVQERLSIGLLSSSNSPGGRFLCNIRAVPVTQPPSTPCSCGWKKTNRIVGGSPTGVNEYPSMAGLVDVRIRRIKCGCVLISARHVLTAAHCLLGHNVTTLGVIVGEHDITVADSPATQIFRVIRLLMHPAFDDNTYDYDVGIVTTATPVVFSERVGPICLPYKYRGATFAGDTVEALGWGTLFPGGPTSDVLLKVKLDVISNPACQSRISSLTSRQLCTFTPGKDACQDDSGGPLLYQEPSSGLLYSVGIISSGQFCASAEYPAINTRVTSYLDWIDANTPGVVLCRKP